MNETRSIYLGNGKEITVDLFKDVISYLDTEKLEKIILENPEKEVYVGASTDWYWTAQKIDKEGVEKMKTGGNPGVLRSSSWDTFSVEIDEERQDCTIKIPKKIAQICFDDGFWRGIQKIEFWLKDVYSEGIRKMNYEQVCALRDELNPIIEKHLTLFK